jgi:type VI secretion system secreted protein Hcp
MAAFMKIKDIPGQATDAGHKEWILLDSMSMPLFRKIEQGARDNTRFQSDTIAGDVCIVRTVDKSSPKFSHACVAGEPIAEVLIHLTTQANNKQETYVEIKLENVLVSSYSVHCNAETRGSEEVSMNYTKYTYTYFTLDPKDAGGKGKVVCEYDLGAGKG